MSETQTIADANSEPCITVTRGVSGFFAVLVADFWTDDGGRYRDVVQTGVGRYNESADAWAEARDWAEAEGIRLEDDRP